MDQVLNKPAPNVDFEYILA